MGGDRQSPSTARRCSRTRLRVLAPEGDQAGVVWPRAEVPRTHLLLAAWPAEEKTQKRQKHPAPPQDWVVDAAANRSAVARAPGPSGPPACQLHWLVRPDPGGGRCGGQEQGGPSTAFTVNRVILPAETQKTPRRITPRPLRRGRRARADYQAAVIPSGPLHQLLALARGAHQPALKTHHRPAPGGARPQPDRRHFRNRRSGRCARPEACRRPGRGNRSRFIVHRRGRAVGITVDPSAFTVPPGAIDGQGPSSPGNQQIGPGWRRNHGLSASGSGLAIHLGRIGPPAWPGRRG